MYHVIPSNKYLKSLKRISQHKDFDVKKHKEIVSLLKSNEKLAPWYRDHELKGEMAGFRECHIQNDILLVYQRNKDVLILLLVNMGTHSSLFK